MSKSQTLKALLNERLAAVAEDIFELFERAMAEYEEELRRSKEETEGKQQVLDLALCPQVLLHKVDVQSYSCSHDTSPNQEIMVTLQCKEEQSIKEEDGQFPEISAVSLKSEEQSLPPQRQTERREATQTEECGGAEADTKLDPHGRLHSETEEQIDNSSDCGNITDEKPPVSSSAQEMETEADGDSNNQAQIKDISTATQNSILFTKYSSLTETAGTVTDGDISLTNVEGCGKKHECSVCKMPFMTKHDLEVHKQVHKGEKLYCCAICHKSFTQKAYLKEHNMRLHPSEKPYSCSICQKEFSQSNFLNIHMHCHSDIKPFSCSVCKKTFAYKPSLKIHMRTHTGEKPYSCSLCEKIFAQAGNLVKHMRTHTGEKPYQCSDCKRIFSQKIHLEEHMRTHTGEKPYSCSVCQKIFTQKGNLVKHLRIHTGERPYSCEVCNKVFAQKGNLKRHEKSHVMMSHS